LLHEFLYYTLFFQNKFLGSVFIFKRIKDGSLTYVAGFFSIVFKVALKMYRTWSFFGHSAFFSKFHKKDWKLVMLPKFAKKLFQSRKFRSKKIFIWINKSKVIAILILLIWYGKTVI